MNEYIHLIGAEEVNRASYKINKAADTMIRAAGNLDEVFIRHENFMNDWLERFEQILKENKTVSKF